ncbi:hypothetical protein ACDP63_09985 [Paracoccus sp. P2]|uniref:hypothetical protein n=1 Tax=Paracoccus sp. P2 TaxID=3248840 RepID=UPI00391F1562
MLEVKQSMFVSAARVLGASSGRIIFRHILPVVRDFADHVMVMQRGKAVAPGPVRLVFEGRASPVPRRCWPLAWIPIPRCRPAAARRGDCWRRAGLVA